MLVLWRSLRSVFYGNRVFRVNILSVNSSSVLFGHNPCSVRWSSSFTLFYFKRLAPCCLNYTYNYHLPVISSQQIMVHECDWGVTSVSGCSIGICHHTVGSHFIRRSAWNDYLAFISISYSAKLNPCNHVLHDFDVFSEQPEMFITH